MECIYEELNVDKEKRRKYLMSNLRSKLDWLKLNTDHDIAYIGVCGSQNYGCDIYTPEYMSDVDAKAICIPSLEDLIRSKKMVSHTYVMDDNSHIDVKDIRLYMDLWKKANPSFLEILFTEFNIVVNDRFNQILDMADDISDMNFDRFLSSCKGMIKEKVKNMCRVSDKSKDEIEKYGYKSKELHHIYRLFWMVQDMLAFGDSFRRTLDTTPETRKFLIELKTTHMDKDEAIEIAKTIDADATDLIDYARKTGVNGFNEETYERLSDIIYQIIFSKCVEEIRRLNKRG